MDILGHIALVVLGIGSGMVVAGAVFAFIAAIGVVPRLAQKTGTQANIKLYEASLMLGGMFGVSTDIINFHISIGAVFTALFAACVGIFIGVLSVSLAETLDVISIMARRIRLQKGLVYFMLAIALGKMGGSLLYALVPGFYTQ